MALSATSTASDDVNTFGHTVFIGCGQMGEALLAGWLEQGVGTVQSYTVVEHSKERCDHLHQRYGVLCTQNADSVQCADRVILAVKPQVLREVVQGIAANPAFQESLFISLAAGVATATLLEILPLHASLVRVMPNLPLMVGEGATVVCGSDRATVPQIEEVRGMFARLGIARIIPEDLIDAASALSGSGPAYVAAFIEVLTKAGVAQGLDASLAQDLALQTVYGTACQLKETGQEPAALRKAVSSPGGTTLAALAAFEEAGLGQAYEKGIAAAVQRAKELG